MRRRSPSARRVPVVVAVLASAGLIGASAVLAADLDWRRVELQTGATPSRVEGITYGAGTFVAVGSEGDPAQPAVWLSADGSDWRRATDITEETEPSVMRSVTVAAPAFLAVGSVGDEAAMWSSNADGTGWRRVLVATFGGAEMHAVEGTWAGTIAVGFDTDTQSAGIWREENNQWSQIPATPDFDGIRLLGIETGSFDIIAVGEDVRDGSAAALITADGISWTRLPELEINAARLHDAHWGPFTVVGALLNQGVPPGPRELISYDVSGGGSDEWRSADVQLPRGAELTAVDFSGEGEVAVGFDAADSAAVVYETGDFQTWTAAP